MLKRDLLKTKAEVVCYCITFSLPQKTADFSLTVLMFNKSIILCIISNMNVYLSSPVRKTRLARIIFSKKFVMTHLFLT